MIPVKVVVFGKGEAGKSTLIQGLIPDAMNIERGGRTVAMDYGFVSFEGWTFHLWGTPGQARFEPVREVLVQGIDVAVFVIDSSRYFDEEDKRLLEEVERQGVPYLLFVNHKPDGQKERRSTERLMEGFPKPSRIVEGSAKNPATVSQFVSALKEMARSLAPDSSM
ncbi:GTP-binding protein [bacterium]|nr:GTP-binding protein [bacterium]